jgi:hypothetical protein
LILNQPISSPPQSNPSVHCVSAFKFDESSNSNQL